MRPLVLRGLVLLTAAIYLGIGAWVILDPAGAMAPAGVTLDDAGLVEARAMYGGLQLGMAAFLLTTVRERPRVGVLAGTLTIGGLGLARAAALLTSGVGGLHVTLAIIECIGGAVGAAALWWTRERST